MPATVSGHQSAHAAGHGLAVAPGQRIEITVPATSANLGPGFDSLGLALGLTDTLRVETIPAAQAPSTTASLPVTVRVEGEGAESLPTDATHLIAQTILRRWEQLGVSPAGLRIHATNRIPHGRGLGSSAAAIVSALAAAEALLPESARAGEVGGRDFRDAIFAEAARLEGHPDNVAPATYGGLTLSLTEGESMLTHALPLHASVVPVVAIPAVELSTHAARGLLPAQVPHADAAANSARAGLLIRALTGDPSLLHAGTRDYLHQSYRAEAMAESARLIEVLRDQGSAAVVSGAGPTVMVLADGAEAAQAVAAEITSGRHGVWRVEIPGLCASGVMVEVL